MTWLAMSSMPNVKDAEFRNDTITIYTENHNVTCRLWLQKDYGIDPLLFLYRLRFAVDEAIRHNLDLDNQKSEKEEN